jgi:hypothetical protein
VDVRSVFSEDGDVTKTDLTKTIVKSLLLTGLGLFGAGLLGGCSATPAYSGDERAAQIGRNMNFELESFADDVDSALLLRPSNTLTVWDVDHRN